MLALFAIEEPPHRQRAAKMADGGTDPSTGRECAGSDEVGEGRRQMGPGPGQRSLPDQCIGVDVPRTIITKDAKVQISRRHSDECNDASLESFGAP